MRSDLMSSLGGFFPIRQFIVCMLCFLGYECLCLSLPEAVAWMGCRDPLNKILIAYSIMIILAALGELYLYKFYVEPTIIQEEMIKLNLGIRMNWQKMAISCAVGFLGGVLEGLIGFGFYFAMFLYLIYCGNDLKDTIATCGFFNIFVGAVFSLNSIFCGSFNWVTYISLFFIILAAGGGAQYLFDSYFNSSVGASSIKSTLAVLLIVVICLCLVSVLGSLGLSWGRFGFSAISQLGDIPKC